MNFWKKGISLLLIICMVALSACGSNPPAPEPDTAMGRYIEERWELPMDADNIFILTRRHDGKIFALMDNMGVKGDGSDVTVKGFTTTNGRDWQEDTPSWMGALLEKGGSIGELSYGKNGECFLIYDLMEGDDYFRRVARVTPDGTLEDVDGEWEKAVQENDTISYTKIIPASDDSQESEAKSNDEPMEESESSVAIEEIETDIDGAETEQTDSDYRLWPTGIVVGDDGDIYVGRYEGVGRFGPDGKYKSNIDSFYPKYTFYGGSVAILDYGSVRGDMDTLKLFDTDTGEERQDLGLNALQSPQQGAVIATGPDGALYIANPNGIYRLVPDGTTWERMVDGNLCSLSVPSMSIDKFIPHGDNEFLTLSTVQDKPALINYTYSASTPTRPDTELTVATLRKNQTLLQAAGEFRRANPNVIVTVQTLLEEDGSATAADAIRALNTQLLAGKGPDLLLLDGLPLDSYIEKGVLADMSEWLNPIIEGELVPNVAGAFGENGKQYAVPARFNMPTIWGRPESVSAASNLESVTKYAETDKTRKLLYAMDRETLFRYFYTTSAPEWLDGGKLNETAFAEYLELIARLANTLPGDAREKEKVNTRPGFTMDGIDTGGAVDVAYNRANLFSAELFGFYSLMVPNGAIAALNGIEMSEEMTSVEDSQISSHLALMPGQTSGVFVPSCIMGINDAGKQQELAREFIETVLGETVQYNDLQDGFPVNRNAIEKNVVKKGDMWMSFSGENTETGEYYIMEMAWPSQGVFRAVCGLFDKLDTPYTPDDILMEMILGETAGFFDESKSVAETAAAVASRLELYLAEQN